MEPVGQMNNLNIFKNSFSEENDSNLKDRKLKFAKKSFLQKPTFSKVDKTSSRGFETRPSIVLSSAQQMIEF